MKPTDITAITAGSVTGASLSESAESIIASIGAAVAVYLARALIDYLCRRFGQVNKPPGGNIGDG